MLDSIINDVTGIFRATFMTGDWTGLVIAFGSVLVASLLMKRGGQIGSMTLLALVLFAFGGFVRGFFRATPTEGTQTDRAAGQLQASWNAFMDLQAGTLLAYFIAFMLLILILFGLRSVLNRG